VVFSVSLDRIRGSLLGGAVGDALGAAIEFSTLADIRTRFGPAGVTGYVSAYGRLGAITDDTQMTLFTAEGLIRASQRFGDKGIVDPPSVIHRAYLRWLDTQGLQGDGSRSWLASTADMRHRRAPGNTCQSALQSGVMGTIDNPINNSKGCGGVMRIGPIGLVIDEPFDLAARAAAITHGHPSGFLPSGALAVMLRALVKGGTLAEAVGEGFRSLDGRKGADETIDALGAAIALSRRGVPTPEKVETLGGGWVGEEALAIAVYCAFVATGFDHGILLAANHSGDSDSTASIAGQLLGAAGGTEVIADRWLEPLELRAEIERLARDLHRYLILAEDIPWEEYPGS
jgi:ADP-ribosyl-[dinitrogen reductase] hydrolase